MNSFLCWLTGGHKYSDLNLMIHTDHETDEAVFENICIKCGKPFETRIGWRYLSIMHKPQINIPNEIIDSVLGEDE